MCLDKTRWEITSSWKEIWTTARSDYRDRWVRNGYLFSALHFSEKEALPHNRFLLFFVSFSFCTYLVISLPHFFDITFFFLWLKCTKNTSLSLCLIIKLFFHQSINIYQSNCPQMNKQWWHSKTENLIQDFFKCLNSFWISLIYQLP